MCVIWLKPKWTERGWASDKRFQTSWTFIVQLYFEQRENFSNLLNCRLSAARPHRAPDGLYSENIFISIDCVSDFFWSSIQPFEWLEVRFGGELPEFRSIVRFPAAHQITSRSKFISRTRREQESRTVNFLVELDNILDKDFKLTNLPKQPEPASSQTHLAEASRFWMIG